MVGNLQSRRQIFERFKALMLLLQCFFTQLADKQAAVAFSKCESPFVSIFVNHFLPNWQKIKCNDLYLIA